MNLSKSDSMYVRSLRPSYFLKFFILTLALLLLIGCEYKYTIDEYKLKYLEMKPRAELLCDTYGQKYLEHHTKDFLTWETMCITENPLKIHHKVIE